MEHTTIFLMIKLVTRNRHIYAIGNLAIRGLEVKFRLIEGLKKGPNGQNYLISLILSTNQQNTNWLLMNLLSKC